MTCCRSVVFSEYSGFFHVITLTTTMKYCWRWLRHHKTNQPTKKGTNTRSHRTFNIFQVYEYFFIYRWYFLLKFEQYSHEYLTQYSLKSGGTKDHFRLVKVPGTVPYWKACHWKATLTDISVENKWVNG